MKIIQRFLTQVVFLSTFACLYGQDTWTSRYDLQDLPGNNLVGGIWGDNKFYLWNDAWIFTSQDGKNWKIDTMKVPLQKVIYGKNTYVAIGRAAGIFTSTDGLNWTDRDTNTPQCILLAKDMFYAFCHSDSSFMLSSQDGLTWTKQIMNAQEKFTRVVYGNDFFAAQSDYAVYVSSDGINWNAKAIVYPANYTMTGINSLLYANGRLIILFSGYFTDPYSFRDDFRELIYNNWTKVYELGDGLSDVICTGKYLIAIGNRVLHLPAASGAVFDSPILISTDGTNWVQRISNTKKPLNIAAGGNNVLMAAGAKTIVTSEDDSIWINRTIESAPDYTDISFGNGKWLIMPDSRNGGTMMTSNKECIEWVPSQFSLEGYYYDNGSGPACPPYIGITYGKDLFIQLGFSMMNSSPDGINWQNVKFSNKNIYFRSITYGSDNFVANAWDIDSQRNVRYNSIDGQQWSRNNTCPQGIIKWMKDRFTSFASGYKYSSPDGYLWSIDTLNTNSQIIDFTRNDECYVALSNSGIMKSNDGKIWTICDSSRHFLNSIAFGEGKFVAVGDSGKIIASQDGVSWERKECPKRVRLNKVTYGNNFFTAVGDKSTILTSPLVQTPIKSEGKLPNRINFSVAIKQSAGNQLSLIFGNPKPQAISITIFNCRGQKIFSIEKKLPGQYTDIVHIQPAGMSNGIYYLDVKANWDKSGIMLYKKINFLWLNNWR